MKEQIKEIYRVYMNTKKTVEQKQDYKLIVSTRGKEFEYEKRTTSKGNNK